MDYYLGCSGWHYKDWKNSFYKGVPKKDWFDYYAKKFNTVEINSSFYRFPKPKTGKKWYDEAPSGFTYSIKANRIITHYKKFNETKRLIDDFYKAVSETKEKLGCVLFQLHPNLHYDEELLDEIIRQLDKRRKNVIEFRHESWWNKKVYKKMEQNNLIFCIVSSPELPKDFVKTNEDIYIRFHGEGENWYHYDYSDNELKKFAEKIKKSGAKNVWAYFNNDYNAHAPNNCLRLRGML
jgi:uncharacterized protein YecE (DUF72 family)